MGVGKRDSVEHSDRYRNRLLTHPLDEEVRYGVVTQSNWCRSYSHCPPQAQGPIRGRNGAASTFGRADPHVAVSGLESMPTHVTPSWEHVVGAIAQLNRS